jgi:molybdopterin-binding protein
MNRLYGTIKKVQHAGTINRVVTDCGGVPFSCVTLDLSENFKEGSEVAVVFKETEVALARIGEASISISNMLTCTVASVEEGEILSEVELEFEGKRLRSIITTDSLKRLDIRAGEVVTALVKANEVSLEGARGD